MAVNKVIQLATGGTLTLSVDGINLFETNEKERALLEDLAAAVRKYERQVATGNGMPAALTAGGGDR